MSAISDYFRTAMLIDDRVESDYQKPETVETGNETTSNSEPESGLVTPPNEDETPVSPSSLVNAFLEKGVVCSIVEARQDGPDPIELASRGARIADLVILDWLLFGNASKTVKAIVTIAEQNESRLQVIVVYTGANSLSDVAERLVQDAGFTKDDDFVLRCRSTVVLIFGKPGSPLTGGEDRRQPSTDCNLPTMICNDLELVFKGLMPRFAFSGINALRESVPQILATFNSDLDAPALVHRALLPEPADAGPQFVQLLASDFEQVLHDERVDDVWDKESVRTHLENTSLLGSSVQLAKKLKSKQDACHNSEGPDDLEIVRKAITSGLSEVGMSDNAITKALDPLVDAVGDNLANEALAVLMSASELGETPPRLELGVVVQDENERLWLCIQALCDSVRLKESRAFPMLPLCSDAKPPVAMIRLPNGDYRSVGFDTRPYHLSMPKFAPTNGGSVVVSGEPSNWHFTCEDGVRFRAVTRLRPEIAAQAVHGVASAATRAGANISEWLRRGGAAKTAL